MAHASEEISRSEGESLDTRLLLPSESRILGRVPRLGGAPDNFIMRTTRRCLNELYKFLFDGSMPSGEGKQRISNRRTLKGTVHDDARSDRVASDLRR